MNDDMTDEQEWTTVNYKKTIRPRKTKLKPSNNNNKNKKKNVNLIPKWVQDLNRKSSPEDYIITQVDRIKLAEYDVDIFCDCCCAREITKILQRWYMCRGCYCCMGDTMM